VFAFKLVTSVLLKKIMLDERLLLRASRETCTVITSYIYALHLQQTSSWFI